MLATMTRNLIGITRPHLLKGALMGTPNREPQEYGQNMIGIYLPGSRVLIFLCSWGSLFGVPIEVLLLVALNHKPYSCT